MARLPLPRIVRTIPLLLLLQAGMLLAAGFIAWTVAGQPLGSRSWVPLLIGAVSILALTLAASVMIGINWQREADQGLHEVHDRFRHLVDSIDGIVWESDPITLDFHFVSMQAVRLLGYPLEDWYADPLFWRKHLHPDDRELAIALFDAAEAKLLPFTAEYRMVKANGEAVWIRDIVSLTVVDGRATLLQGVMVDITERKHFQEELERAFREVQDREADLTSYKDHLEELVMQRSEALIRANAELRSAMERAEESNRMKSNFLSNMSHELRTPLNAIILYSDLIMDEAKVLNLQETQDDLDKIQRAGKHLLSLIDDILDLSKIEAGRIELQIDDVDVPMMLQEITFNIAPLVGKNRNTLVIEADPAIGTIVTDEIRLRQILINLLGNACKFTSDGTITLGVQSGGEADEVVFFVRDTGIGLTREQQGRIFQRFTQADDSTTRKFGGTGLGLALSRRLAELLDCLLWVESEPGKGSTFFLKLGRQGPLAPG